MTLTEFLLARIAEDEATARSALLTEGQRTYLWDGFEAAKVAGLASQILRGTFDPARVLAECEAKRRVVELHAEDSGMCSMCTEVGPQAQGWPCDTLRALALPYADHPDYREEFPPHELVRGPMMRLRIDTPWEVDYPRATPFPLPSEDDDS